MLPQERDIWKKNRGNKLDNELLKQEWQFKAVDNKEYEVKTIINSIVYDSGSNGKMPGLQ